jgi:type IV pilus assembly protein PilM
VFGRKKVAVGLDVGSHSIKSVQLTVAGSSVQISGSGYREIPSPEARAETLKQFVSDEGLKGHDVVTGVAGRSVIVRYVNMRKMDPSELKNAIRFEADKYIPFSIDEVVLDCQPIDGTENIGPEEMKVLLVAVKRNLIEEHVNLLRSAGVNPVIIDVDGFALGNAHTLVKSDSEAGVRALVDIGSSKTNINVMDGDRSLFTREVYVGGADFSDVIGRRLNINPFEVEKIKANPGEKESEVKEAVQSVTDDLANEVRLSLNFFENEFDRQVASVVFSGGGARLVGLAEALGATFGKPAEVWDPSTTFETHFGRGGEDVFRERAPQLAVAIGLAARMGRT